jgi:hypothetical protein
MKLIKLTTEIHTHTHAPAKSEYECPVYITDKDVYYIINIEI